MASLVFLSITFPDTIPGLLAVGVKVCAFNKMMLVRKQNKSNLNFMNFFYDK
jgi:hypothetical protein